MPTTTDFVGADYRDAWRGLSLRIPQGWRVQRYGEGLRVYDGTGQRMLLVQPRAGILTPEALAQELVAWLRGQDPQAQAWLLPADPARPELRGLRTRLTAGGVALAGAFNLQITPGGQGGLVSGFMVPAASYEQDAALAGASLATLQGIPPTPRNLWREPSQGAATALVPQGWQAGGGVTMSNGVGAPVFQTSPGNPVLVYATGEGRIYSEGGMGMFSLLPSPFPQAPFVDAATYAQSFLLPGVRQQAADAQLLGIEPRPEAVWEMVQDQVMRAGVPAELVLQGQPTAVDARISYSLAGTPMQQVTRIWTSRIPPQMTSGQPVWAASQPYAYRAPVAQLEELEPVLEGVAQSFKADPMWQNAQTMRAQQYAQWSAADRSRRLMEIGRTLSQTSDIITQGYNQRQATYDRISHNWSQAMLGRTELGDSYGTVYNIQNLYAQQYWRSPDGTIYGTGALFNPDPSWERLTPVG